MRPTVVSGKTYHARPAPFTPVLPHNPVVVENATGLRRTCLKLPPPSPFFFRLMASSCPCTPHVLGVFYRADALRLVLEYMDSRTVARCARTSSEW